MEIENKLRRLSRPYRSDSFPGKIRDAINSLEKSGIDALMVELKKR